MPPKIYKRPTAAQQVSRPKQKDQEVKDPLQHAQQLFMNPKHLGDNKKALQKMRLLTTVLAGVISGILSLNQLEGPFMFLVIHLILSGLLYTKVGNIQNYFGSKWALLQGIGGGILLFICIWMIVFNIVHVL